jgi:D-mannonate dehydratase
MYLYNVTLIVDDAAAAEWLDWMQTEHVPRVMATGKFLSSKLLRVVDSPNEGVTFCAQYLAETIADYEEYQAEFAPALQQELNDKFKDRFVAFRTLMQYVD